MNELGAEGDVELEQLPLSPLGPEPRHHHEATDILGPAARGLVIDRVAAPEQACHQRLGDAGRQRRGDGHIGGASTSFQDLDAGLDGGGVARCDRCRHSTRAASMPMLTNPLRGKLNRSPRHSPSAITNSFSPIGRESTFVIASVAVKGFVIEAIRKTVSGNTLSGRPSSQRPSAAVTISSRRTPNAMSGTSQRSRASAAHSASSCAETGSIRGCYPTARPRPRPCAFLGAPCGDRGDAYLGGNSASHQGSKTGDHRPARPQRGGYRLAPGADRTLDTACQRAHGAPEGAPEGPLFAARPAEAGRPPAAAPAVPAKARPRGIPRLDPGARPQEIMGEIRCQASAWLRRELHATEGGSLSERAADALTQTSTFKKEVEDR